MYRLLLAVTVLLLSTSISYAGFAEGLAAYDRGDYATAAREYRQAAEQGEARAQTLLGLLYSRGEGVPQDYAEAFKWLHQAAAQGTSRAQGILGGMYYFGEGVPQDYVEAFK